MDGLRVELQSVGIHVTTVCPSWVRTPLTAQLEGDLEHILDVDVAAAEIAYAIKDRLPFYTFPAQDALAFRVLMMLPRSWQDYYIRQLMHRGADKEGAGPTVKHVRAAHAAY